MKGDIDKYRNVSNKLLEIGTDEVLSNNNRSSNSLVKKSKYDWKQHQEESLNFFLENSFFSDFGNNQEVQFPLKKHSRNDELFIRNECKIIKNAKFLHRAGIDMDEYQIINIKINIDDSDEISVFYNKSNFLSEYTKKSRGPLIITKIDVPINEGIFKTIEFNMGSVIITIAKSGCDYKSLTSSDDKRTYFASDVDNNSSNEVVDKLKEILN